jgi:hypothetical protein
MQTLQLSDQAATYLHDMAQQEHLTSGEFIERLINEHHGQIIDGRMSIINPFL